MAETPETQAQEVATQVWPGRPFPLGANYDGSGTNFSIFSEVAERVQLCLYDEDGNETQVDLPEVTDYCWHGYLPDIGPGQRYGYRVHGPWAPDQGHRCNPAKLLLDPYAKSIDGEVQWAPAVFPYVDADRPGERDDSDSAPFVPKSVVVNPFFDWSRESRPDVPLHQTIIYEVHVKGFTALHPKIPEADRGTYAGLAHPEVIDYLTDLGVTTLELMPIHQFLHDKYLLDKGLRNYWGYNTIGYFAPHNEYVSTADVGRQVQEFKEMVRHLHEAGLEVILDVVYNHSAEGNHLGPMLGFKGVDNAAYYRLDPDDPAKYTDYTGTGNTLNVRHPHVLQMVMDSLRYWVTEMHVDGFRFDLASALARALHDVDRLSAFFAIIQQDPVISQVKLIAEPWDVGEGGYQVGKFPPRWSEWNGKYRDTIRDFWRGADRPLGEVAHRFAGSSDLYEATGRRPHASVNFVTAHDGFTLRDLVSYEQKHNEANGEDNNDGQNDNRSWNCGVEGQTDDPQVNYLRDRQKRNFLATLLLSQGLPMILHGDEIGRTQEGNNNAYCQDNELSWLHWDQADQRLREFTRRLIRIRRQHPVFRQSNWFMGKRSRAGLEDISWHKPDGSDLSPEQWNEPARGLQVFFSGDINATGPRGEKIHDACFYVLMNAGDEPMQFRLADVGVEQKWEAIVDTSQPAPPEGQPALQPEDEVTVPEHSIIVLRSLEDEADEA